MKMTVAESLNTDETNSSSAYPRVPKTLMMMMKTQNIVIQTATLISLSQNCTVNETTVNSSGKTMIHWKTCSGLESVWPHSQGTYIIPAHSETPRGVNEPSRVRVETTRDRVHDRELSERVDNIEDHNTSDKEADEQRGWATPGEGATCTNEETRTNGTSNSNHMQVAALHRAIKLDIARTPITCEISVSICARQRWR